MSNLNPVTHQPKYKQFYLWITSRDCLIFLAVSLIAIILHNVLINKYDHWIVIPLFSNIYPTYKIDAVFISLLVICGLAISRCIKEKVLLPRYLLIAIILLFSVYSYYRFFGDHFKISTHIKYSDILIVISLGIFLVKIAEWTNKPIAGQHFDDPFFSDLPIRQSEDDRLDREGFATRIAQKIQSKTGIENSGALAIGITGAWGSGKTSFSNMVLEKIDKTRIVIRFNPWRSANSAKIIEDFFELLIAELCQYDPELSRNLYRYARTLTNIDENNIIKGFRSAVDLYEEFNKNETYQAINQSIDKINRQIIIFIDDLDRLDKKEILEVLRIIRNTANFNQLVYLVAYDKSYVLEAVKSFNPHNYTYFLEKIFQFEFTLPLYEATVIHHFIWELLTLKLPEKLHYQLNIILESRAYIGRIINDELIQTHREAIRLANSLLFEIQYVQNDVLFYDFYLLQLLKIKFPRIYDELIQQWESFFIIYSDKNESYFRFRNESERDQNIANQRAYMLDPVQKTAKFNSEKKLNISIFYNFLCDLKTKDLITKKNLEIIFMLVEELLNADRAIQKSENEKYKSFVNPNNFFKYFAFQLLKTELSAKDFEEARLLSYTEYKNIYEDWIVTNKQSSFIDKLYRIVVFSSKLEFENHIKTLFDMGRKLTNNDRRYNFDYQYLISTLKYPVTDTKLSETLLYDNLNDYRGFLNTIFLQAPFPFGFESTLAAQIIAHSYEFPLPIDELSIINLNYFKSYLAEEGELNNIFWQLYHNCKTKLDDGISYDKNPTAKELGVNYYLTHLQTEKMGDLINQTNPDSELYHFSIENLSFFFETSDKIDDWLQNASQLDRNSPFYREFIQFYEKTKTKQMQPIKFDFKYLKPVRWRNM